MSGNIREIVESHQCFCKAVPFYIAPARVPADFDLDIYAVKMSFQPDPPAEFWLVYTKIKQVVDVVLHENNHACTITVIPFGSAVILDTTDYLQSMAMLRIRITHSRGAQELVGTIEQEALRAVEAQLNDLGITASPSRRRK